jgi:type III secretion protein U
MAKDDAEEKKHDPTESRIRQLRRDGQIAHSANFPQSVSLLVVVIYMALAFDWVSGQLQRAFKIDMFAPSLDFPSAAWQLIQALAHITLIVAGPILALAVGVTILAAAIDMRGLPLSAKNISPNFDRINPTEGFKRLFKMQAAVELIKGILKTLMMFAALITLAFLTLNATLWSPTCGAECTLGAAKFVIGSAVIIGAILLLVFGIADIPVSRMIFTHENRMTPTEYKRDRKESLGNPVIKGARRQQGRAMIEAGPVSDGLINFLVVGEGVAVGLRFIRNETPAPVTMAKRLGPAAETLILMAKGKNLPVIEDKELALALGQRAPAGEQIPQALFDPMARALVKAKML